MRLRIRWPRAKLSVVRMPTPRVRNLVSSGMCVCVCVCALYFDEVDPCAALGWTSHSAQVC